MPKTKYGYDILTETLNGQVDSSKLSDEILFSSIVTSLSHINTSGADAYMDVFFSDAITSGEKITLDAYVAAHDGYSTVDTFQFWESNSAGPITQQTYQNAMSRTAEPMSSGIYRLSWYFELKIVTTGALNSNGQARFMVDDNTKGSVNHRSVEWSAFSGWDRYVATQGETPVLSIEYRRDPTEGGNDSIDIRKVKIGIEFMG